MLFLIKICLTMVETCRILRFSQDFVFSFSSKAEQDFPDAHGALQLLFGRFL